MLLLEKATGATGIGMLVESMAYCLYMHDQTKKARASKPSRRVLQKGQML
jgi:hypothetical protein